MIAMLGHSEVDTEVSNTDMKTMGSKMLIVCWWQHERKQDLFFYKNRQNFINPFI